MIFHLNIMKLYIPSIQSSLVEEKTWVPMVPCPSPVHYLHLSRAQYPILRQFWRISFCGISWGIYPPKSRDSTVISCPSFEGAFNGDWMRKKWDSLVMELVFMEPPEIPIILVFIPPLKPRWYSKHAGKTLLLDNYGYFLDLFLVFLGSKFMGSTLW